MVPEMCLGSLLAVVGVLFVSQLGADAVAAVGLTEGIWMILYSPWGWPLALPQRFRTPSRKESDRTARITGPYGAGRLVRDVALPDCRARSRRIGEKDADKDADVVHLSHLGHEYSQILGDTTS